MKRNRTAEPTPAAASAEDETDYSEFVVTLANTPSFGQQRVKARDPAHAIERVRLANPQHASRDARNFLARPYRPSAPVDTFADATTKAKATAEPTPAEAANENG